VALDGSEVRFGRSRECDVVLSDTFASERHARVFPREGAWMVADMGSTNGTYVNRRRVHEPTPINAGDQVTIGKTIVEVRR
jgi:pSer/pThr/pTyr-binding forkhead associated (FHA) protein